MPSLFHCGHFFLVCKISTKFGVKPGLIACQMSLFVYNENPVLLLNFLVCGFQDNNMKDLFICLPTISITGFDLAKKKEKNTETWLDKQLKELTNGSVAKEMAIGGVSGWCAGIVFSKVGKTAASALAGSLVMFQIAQRQGYIKVNWKKVNGDIEKAKRKLDKSSKQEMHWFLQEAQTFVNEYKFLVTGFAGGFLIAISMC